MDTPAITITNLIWSFDRTTQQVNLLLIKRAEAPFQNDWALPETVMRATESADDAALRLVREKIGLDLARFHTEQLATFTQPQRTPAAREVSLAYLTFLPTRPVLTPSYGAVAAKWFALNDLPVGLTLTDGDLNFTLPNVATAQAYYQLPRPEMALAFDHDWLVQVAVTRIRNKLDYQPNILLILGESFTLKEARLVFATFLQQRLTDLDNSNFQKTHQHLLMEVGTSSAQHPGRPAKVYRLNYL
ncbi:NUDIX hydrolase [Levilactobacillus cerevisiae]|uniref:NUDIX hydrolase n=1 Tax=Levilactobacillus cerevisiae TaxID=1704076 RepID=UPI000F77EDBF|nr:NUDIX domain-containing protein [Levilactobacillus cerevisiae]